MTAAIAARYGGSDDGNPVATVTAVHIEATDLTVNETQTAQNIIDGVYAAPITYYLTAECTGVDTLTSIRFQGPGYEWNDVIFPAAGAWTLHVRQDSDDSSVANVAVTVDAVS
jgi:hypothetical protein